MNWSMWTRAANQLDAQAFQALVRDVERMFDAIELDSLGAYEHCASVIGGREDCVISDAMINNVRRAGRAAFLKWSKQFI